MKKLHYLTLLPLLVAPLLLTGAIPFTDNFDYGALNKDDTAVTNSQGAWYHANFGNGGISQQISGNAMTVTGIPTDSNASAFGYFQNSGNTHAVGIGESITLEIDMSYTGSVDSSFAPFTSIRYGIYNSNGNRETADINGGAGTANFNAWSGYSSTWTIGDTTADGVGETQNRPGADYYRQGGIKDGLWSWGTDAGSNAHDEDAPVSTSGTVANIGDPNAGTDGDILLTLTLSRTGADAMDVTSSFFDGTNTYSTITGTHTGIEGSFDSIAFLVNNGTSSITDFSVDSISVVPEPATYAALFGVLALGVVMWRRRR